MKNQNKNKKLFQSCINKIYNYISFADKSEYEVKKKLYSYLQKIANDISEEDKEVIIQETIEYFKENKLIDDDAYSKKLVETRIISEKPISKMEIKTFLLKKRIPGYLIDKYLVLYTDEIERENILKLVAKKSSMDTKKLKKYLLGKGYSYHSINLTLN